MPVGPERPPPFHLGETITSDLANYNGHITYSSETKGVGRQGTTDVGIRITLLA